MNLQKIDLSKGEKHEHPDINSFDNFLCKIYGKYYAGKFVRVWFGWSFTNWGTSGKQYDSPGSNGKASDAWEGIWKIIEDV